MKQIYVNISDAQDDAMIFVVNNKTYMSTAFMESYGIYADKHYREVYNDVNTAKEEIAEYIANCFKKHDDEENDTFNFMLEELECEIKNGLNFFHECDMSVDEMIETYTNDAFVKIYETED